MRRRFTSSELAGARLWWVLSFEFGGKTWRVANGALSIEFTNGGAGRWLAIPGGLGEATVEMEALWMGRAPEARSGDFEAVVPGLDVGANLAARYELDGQPAEVAVWREGDTWENRLIVLSGQITDYEYGAPGDGIRLTIEESVTLDRAQFPESGATVSAVTWPDAAENAIGVAYPWIIGAPGSDGTQASPALFVRSTVSGGDRELLLVAGHAVTATSVLISDGTYTETVHYHHDPDGTITSATTTTPNVESFLIEHMEDRAGRLVAVVDITSAADIAIDVALDYTAAWTGGAGMVGVSGSAATGAGSILEAVLSRSTLPVDRGALSTVRDQLDAWPLGAMVQEPLSPMEWVTDALLPLLPVAILTGPNGWRVVPLPLEPTQRDCICTLTAGPAVQRIGRSRREGQDEIANRIELRYAVDVVSGNTRKTAVVSEEWDGASHPSLSVRTSNQVYGVRSVSSESVAVYEATAAIRTVRWKAALYAFPRTVITYAVPQYQWLQPGNVVWLVDSELSIEQPAWVQRVVLSPGAAVADLVVWRLNVS